MIDIVDGDLDDPRIVDLLRHHVARARAETAPGSAHAFGLDGLRRPDVSFWSAWDADLLVGVAALMELAPDHGEVKSMHTAVAMRGRGVAGALLRHILATAASRGYSRLSLETGASDYFAPARALYRRHGFADCAPFAAYRPDPHSVFMTVVPQPG